MANVCNWSGFVGGAAEVIVNEIVVSVDHCDDDAGGGE